MGDSLGPPENSHSWSFEEETEPSIQWCLDNGYKIPKWLLKCNIKCPYVKGNIFQGKYGPINYSVAGDPSANLVLTFHGYNATHTTFSIYQSVLSKNGFRVIAFDLYGHGLSGYPRYKVLGNTFCPSFYVEQADEVIEHLGYRGKKLSLIGMSMGACLAASYCEAHPDLVERMVLVSPAGLIPKKPRRVVFLKYIQCCIPCTPYCLSKCCFSRCVTVPKSRFQQNGSRFHDEENVRIGQSPTRVDREAASSPGEGEDEILVEVSEPSGEMNPMVNRMMWTLFVTRRAISSLLGIVNRMPLWTSREMYRRVGSQGKLTLVLFGDSDTLTPPKCADELSNLFKNSHTIVFPNSDHLLSFKKPLQVVSCCLAFLGIPPGEKVKHYTRWLPFDAVGDYIPKLEREFGHPENFDYADEISMEAAGSSVAVDSSFRHEGSDSGARDGKTGKNSLNGTGNQEDVEGTLFSETVSMKKVPLVVVRQFEDSYS